MRAPESSLLAKYQGIKSRQLFHYLEGNTIGGDGCEHLSKANWPNIKKIHLGNFFIMKVAIQFMMTDAST